MFSASLLLLTFLAQDIHAQQQQQQQQGHPVHGWHLLALEKDGVFGISLERAYTELLKNRKAKPVTVAVIDGGVDTGHEDLKDVIFVNKREKPGNQKDDDGNGFIDDVQGWNFLGSSRGSFAMDNTDLVRKLRVALKTAPDASQTARLKLELANLLMPFEAGLRQSDRKLAVMNRILSRIGKAAPQKEELKAYRYRTAEEEKVLLEMVRAMNSGGDVTAFKKELEAENQRYRENIYYQLNIDYDPRSDAEFQQPFYGNGDSKGFNPFHGTHASGIIAAGRHNKTGMDGVSDVALIMPVRIIPDGGDVRDEDIAAAIRYAAANGAKVINMSLGKATVDQRERIDEAVRYAMEKDVLIVHAAGNSQLELENTMVYPARKYQGGGEAPGWIEVAATGDKDDKNLLALFSNYGKTTVDVCAPGVEIYSAWPGNKYEKLSGTSMAAPVVSGLAALIRAYYPKLTAVQVKEIIMKSVIKRAVLEDKCISGGIVNAYEALKLAAGY